MTNALRALAPALAARENLPVETVHRRIAAACLRLARRNDEAKREIVSTLLREAVDDCVVQLRRQSIRDCYRQFQWTALKAGYDTALLPSESTFRRRVSRARAESLGTSQVKGCRVAPLDLEAVVLRVVLSTFEIMPDRTVRFHPWVRPAG